MNFKDQVDKDLRRVFHKTSEFAEVKDFFYDSRPVRANIVIDYVEESEKKAGNGNVEGLFSCDLVVYISLEELGKLPRRGQEFEINGEYYTILKVKDEMGELTIYLGSVME